MDGTSFDRIARLLGGAASRRAGLKALAAAALGLAVRSADPAPPAAAKRTRPAGPCGDLTVRDNRCTADAQCCTGFCKKGIKNKDGNGRCRCIRANQPCKPDQTCCTGACTNGRCPGRKRRCAKPGAKCVVRKKTKKGKRRTLRRACCQGACQNGTCPKPKLIPTGQACVAGKDTCEDPQAECVAYDSGDPTGTYCLKQSAEGCTEDSHCQTQFCNPSGFCDCMVCLGGTCKYASIQAAIDGEPAGASISIKQDIYTEKFTANKTQVLAGCAGARVTMTGDSQTTPVALLNNAATVTMIRFDISGNSAKEAISVTNAAVLDLRDSTVNGNHKGVKADFADVTIDGSTFDGNADGAIWLNWEAGFQTDPGSRNTLTITNTTVQNNTTLTNNPGGIMAQFATVTITDCIVKNNDGPWGSGIACWSGSDTTIGGATVIEGNTGQGGPGVFLGIYISNSTATMTIGGTTQIKNNDALYLGGGIALDAGGDDSNGQLTLIIKDDVVISGNTAGSGGGAIWVDGNRGDAGMKCHVTLKDRVQVINNHSDCSFGAILLNGANANCGSLTLEGDVTITNNSATNWVGGIGGDRPSSSFTVTGVTSARVYGNTQTQSECAWNLQPSWCSPTSADDVPNCNF